MEKLLQFDTKFASSFVTEEELRQAAIQAEQAKKTLDEGTGEGNDYIGWVDLPVSGDQEEIARIKLCAERIRKDSDVLLVIGIGGSYLGARAAIEFCGPVKKAGERNTEVVYAGQTITSDSVAEMIGFLNGKDWSINVVSKSGTTTESSVAFRIFRALLEKKYGKKEAAARIYATTDKNRGALKTLAVKEGYEQFVIPDDVGGRYSVLTAVGLLPIAAAGIDIDELLLGAQDMYQIAKTESYPENGPMQYAAMRNLLYRKGKKIELMAYDGTYYHYLAEWWKQLFGESEGKGRKGIFPASVEFTTDLHSVGQYIQDGERILMETVATVEQSRSTLLIPEGDSLDELDYLKGKPLDRIRKCAVEATCLAHMDGGVPVMQLKLRERSPRCLGQFFYFFEYACGISGYMLGVNPFNQPGVEAYKKNMFALLGKPGYEEKQKELLGRLS